MYIKNDLIYIPIGVSCINQFQLQFNFSENGIEKGGLFDWTISGTDATLKIFKHLLNNSLHDFFNVEFILDNGYLKHPYIAHYFWHENAHEILENHLQLINFKQKINHQIDNFMNYSKLYKPVFIWSNIQPNLIGAVKQTNQDFSLF